MGEEYTTDYLARLLTEDARITSRKLTQSTRPVNSLKPNTRFLQNIVRGVDQHNTSLRRKEERAAVERLRGSFPRLVSRRPSDGESGSDRGNESIGNDRSRKRRKTDDFEDHKDRQSRKSSKHVKSRASEKESDVSKLANKSSDEKSRDSKSSAKPSDPRSGNAKHIHRKDDVDNASVSSIASVESDDWNKALSAMQDRDKFQRLKNAGVQDSLSRGKKHGKQNIEDDGRKEDFGQLKWSSRGSVREWDIGKSVSVQSSV